MILIVIFIARALNDSRANIAQDGLSPERIPVITFCPLIDENLLMAYSVMLLAYTSICARRRIILSEISRGIN